MVQQLWFGALVLALGSICAPRVWGMTTGFKRNFEYPVGVFKKIGKDEILCRPPNFCAFIDYVLTFSDQMPRLKASFQLHPSFLNWEILSYRAPNWVIMGDFPRKRSSRDAFIKEFSWFELLPSSWLFFGLEVLISWSIKLQFRRLKNLGLVYIVVAKVHYHF